MIPQPPFQLRYCFFQGNLQLATFLLLGELVFWGVVTFDSLEQVGIVLY